MSGMDSSAHYARENKMTGAGIFQYVCETDVLVRPLVVVLTRQVYLLYNNHAGCLRNK